MMTKESGAKAAVDSRRLFAQSFSMHPISDASLLRLLKMQINLQRYKKRSPVFVSRTRLNLSEDENNNFRRAGRRRDQTMIGFLPD